MTESDTEQIRSVSSWKDIIGRGYMEAKVPVPNMLKRDNNSKIGGGGVGRWGWGRGKVGIFLCIQRPRLLYSLVAQNQAKHMHMYINISQFAILVKRQYCTCYTTNIQVHSIETDPGAKTCLSLTQQFIQSICSYMLHSNDCFNISL